VGFCIHHAVSGGKRRKQLGVVRLRTQAHHQGRLNNLVNFHTLRHVVCDFVVPYSLTCYYGPLLDSCASNILSWEAQRLFCVLRLSPWTLVNGSDSSLHPVLCALEVTLYEFTTAVNKLFLA
jgi:hypothetical protein